MKTRLAVPALAFALLVSGCSSSEEPAPEFTSEADRTEAFCNLVEQNRAAEGPYNIDDINSRLQTALEGATSDTDPVAVAAIHTWAETYSELGERTTPFFRDMLAVTEDPQLRKALEINIDLNEDVFMSFLDGLKGVTSVSQFEARSMDLANDMAKIIGDEDSMEALTTLSEYSIKNCGAPLSTVSG